MATGDRGFPFVKAKNFTALDKPRKVDLVVIHTMEAPEKPLTAENVAAWFAGPNAPKASAHFCIDADSVVQSVLEKDVAWHAPGANRNGIGLELAGFAAQKDKDWQDEYSQKVLLNAANVAGAICFDYKIPIEYITESGLILGKRGITTHFAVSRAYHLSTHWDPGPHFPMSLFLELVRAGAFPEESPSQI